MKTFLPRDYEIERNWYHIDATWLTLWKLAVLAANIIRWKNKPYFYPSVDVWDYLIVTNCDKFVVTWNKMLDKKYYSHSRRVKDWLKTFTLKEKMEKDPKFAIREAIYWMLPKNSLKQDMIIRLKLFVWAEHNHQAQTPIVIE